MTTPAKVPVGLGTAAGLGTAFTAFAGGFVSVILNGDHSQETITAFATGTVVLVTTLVGRYQQAVAAIKVGQDPTTAIMEALDEETDSPVDRGLGSPDEPYFDEPDFDPRHEQRDIHEAV